MKNFIKKRSKKNIILYFVIMLSFSLGISALTKELKRYIRNDSELNKIISFRKVFDYTQYDLLKLLKSENISVILQMNLNDVDVMRTYMISNNGVYSEEMKEGNYFSEEEFKSKQEISLVSNGYIDKGEIEYWDKKQNLKKIKTKVVGTTYEKGSIITVPFDIFNKRLDNMYLNDASLKVIFVGKEKDIEAGLKSLEKDMKIKNSENSFEVYDFYEQNISREKNLSINILILGVLVVSISVLSINRLLIFNKRREIGVKKAIGGSNKKIVLEIFKESFVDIIVALLGVIAIQFIMHKNFGVGKENIIGLMCLVSLIGAMNYSSLWYYTYKVQIVDILKEE